MISCNPATWSRDAKILKDGGFSLTSLNVIDQFTYSPHVELVSVFNR
jgi:23S rRNA (uracil1939-C5)-methyltransferase